MTLFRSILNSSQLRRVPVRRFSSWKQDHLRTPQDTLPMPSNLPARHRRIIYRSRQRGMLELDILFGSWCTRNVPNLREEQLYDVEKLLGADTPDVLKWVMRQAQPPERYQNWVLESLRQHAESGASVQSM